MDRGMFNKKTVVVLKEVSYRGFKFCHGWSRGSVSAKSRVCPKIMYHIRKADDARGQTGANKCKCSNAI
jgi:hypothetical protein